MSWDINLPVALVGALKLKEIAYSQAEGVVNVVALQLLAYYTAQERGCPIDFLCYLTSYLALAVDWLETLTASEQKFNIAAVLSLFYELRR